MFEFLSVCCTVTVTGLLFQTFLGQDQKQDEIYKHDRQERIKDQKGRERTEHLDPRRLPTLWKYKNFKRYIQKKNPVVVRVKSNCKISK